MTKKSKSRLEREMAERIRRAQEEAINRAFGMGGTAGRGQEEYTGSWGDAMAAIQRERERRERARTSAYREALDRARRSGPEAAARGPSGPLRRHVVGWRMVDANGSTVALGRSTLWASSMQAARRRAARHVSRETHMPEYANGNGFEIRYVMEPVE